MTTPTTSTTTTTSNDHPPIDDEGLQTSYDVILYGTGLIQSILAAALARVGKSVLHLDPQDFYGELDAVHSLSSLTDFLSTWRNQQNNNASFQLVEKEENQILLQELGGLSTLQVSSMTSSPPSPPSPSFTIGMQVTTPYGMGTIQSIPSTNRLQIQLHPWKLANQTSPILYCDPTKSSSSILVTPLLTHQYHKYIAPQSRNYALDLNPTLVLATGDAVEGMIDSGVSHYCEFKSLLGLYLYMEDGGGKSSSKEEKENGLHISRVPSSRSEVFGTTLLKTLEKRKLMKFFQVAQDYAFSNPTNSTTQPEANEEPRAESRSN